MNPKLTILVAEDEAIIGLSLRIELERAGYVVCEVVATGEQAVAAAVRHCPDIILMDIHMSGEMDGLIAAKQIRAHPQTKDVLIVFMTGYADQQITHCTELLNASACIVKPVSARQIIDVIMQIKMQPHGEA